MRARQTAQEMAPLTHLVGYSSGQIRRESGEGSDASSKHSQTESQRHHRSYDSGRTTQIMTSYRVYDYALLKAPEGDSTGYGSSAPCPDIPATIPISGSKQINFPAFQADRGESRRISPHRGPYGQDWVPTVRCKTRARFLESFPPFGWLSTSWE
jgi:hypothetical protein